MERNTRQRSAIEAVLYAAGRPLTPQEILEAAQQGAPGLGIATVYRQIKALQDAQLIQPVLLPGENPRYELSGLHHHHHFQCTQCQRVFDIHACPGDLDRIAPPGFSVERHELTLYGLCDECGARRGRRKPAVG
ncbi:Fur family transcriptional regulator [Hydrogenophaga intermedia]|jgi:Fur family ferric uptake transcriptional regulator|uniref:Ferric uptake regulation protein n=1 Tax=Hydrogenophaga intermedia TaxID=65786 RepID=A0A1L1PJ32_HYDIT|nr:transcriptional repressor [Hydrogenophaga intermedia]TMU75546.1 transcriptional repressor [Hydrogenophaga intermedia]CDN87953.1 Ferric uptake regulator family protein [Hydrogenophaga intermedia]